jgi:hypothetical protein
MKISRSNLDSLEINNKNFDESLHGDKKLHYTIIYSWFDLHTEMFFFKLCDFLHKSLVLNLSFAGQASYTNEKTNFFRSLDAELEEGTMFARLFMRHLKPDKIIYEIGNDINKGNCASVF